MGSTRDRVVAAPLEFGRAGMDDSLVPEPSFTATSEADQLLLSNPFAFLLGVIFAVGDG